MTRSTARDVERRLKDTQAGEPPADLLERLHAEIPPRLELAAEPPRSARRRLPPPWLRAAAIVVLALGGAWMLWRLSVPVLAPQAAVEEAPAAAAARAPARAPGSSGLPDRRAEIETESAQSLAEDLAAAGEEIADEPEELAEEAAEAGEPRRVASGPPSAAAGTDRRQPPSPPTSQALAAPAAPAEADEPAPRARPFADESRARSFADAGDDRPSSLARHAGAGSWERVRASLRRGELPPAGEVRLSEMVEAVDDGGPPPEPGETFRLSAEGSPSPFAPGPSYRLLRFGIRARTTGTAGPVAEEARGQVDFDPRVVASWRLLGAEDDDLAERAFRLDGDLGGEIGAGHGVTALYEVRLAGAPPPGRPLAHLKLRYRVPGSDRFTETERLLRVADLSPTWEEAPPSLRLAAVAAELAEQLRGSEHAAGADPVDLARLARAAAADFPGDDRAAELAEMAARLPAAAPRRGE